MLYTPMTSSTHGWLVFSQQPPIFEMRPPIPTRWAPAPRRFLRAPGPCSRASGVEFQWQPTPPVHWPLPCRGIQWAPKLIKEPTYTTLHVE